MNELEVLTKWENRFVNLAEHISTWSKDPNTKIGAVVVFDSSRQILSTGYNGMARGVDDTPPIRSSRDREEKYYWYAHGERNAIYNAARYGIKMQGASIYLNCGMPCTGCAIAIIQAGITKVICKAGHPTGELSQKWKDEGDRSAQMFYEAQVKIEFY